MKPNGEFGGVVVRSLRTAGGVLPPGIEISAEDACSWPIMNRRALSDSGIVRWHTQRSDDDDNSSSEKRRGRPAKVKETRQ